MLQIDVLSAFAICGAGALVSAAMLRPALAHDAAGAEALRICRAGYLLIGIGLLLPVWVGPPLPMWCQAVMTLGVLGGLLNVGRAMAVLSGNRSAPRTAGLAMAASVGLVLAAWPAGTRGMTLVCTLGLAATAVLVTWWSRRLVAHPRDLHERLIGVTLLLLLGSSLLRASYLLTWHGPFESHLMYLPPMMITPYTLMYGVLPVIFAMLLHNIINARLLARLHQRAMTDHLTGSLSRHALAEGAATLIALTRQGDRQLAVIMLDLDLFKQVNDAHGHAGGDAALRHAAQVLQAQLRGDALLARYGGEEFVALVPVLGMPVARRVAERMRHSLEETQWPQVLPGLAHLTASVGVTLLTRDESLERALSRADEALYRAKHAGRNQVQVALAAA